MIPILLPVLDVSYVALGNVFNLLFWRLWLTLRIFVFFWAHDSSRYKPNVRSQGKKKCNEGRYQI